MIHPIRRLWLVLAMLLTIPACALGIAFTLFVIGGLYPQTTIEYSPKMIATLCAQFQLDADQEFCHSEQSQAASSLEAALRRTFIDSTSSYADIIGHLDSLTVDSVYMCTPTASKESSADNSINCPHPRQCERDYVCTFRLPESVGWLRLEVAARDGHIKQLFVTLPPTGYTH